MNKGWYTKDNKTIMIAVKTLQGYYTDAVITNHCVVIIIIMHASISSPKGRYPFLSLNAWLIYVSRV